MNSILNIQKIHSINNSSRNKITSSSNFFDQSKSNREDRIFDYSNLKDLTHFEENKRKEIRLVNSLSMRNLSNDDNLSSTTHLSLNYLPRRKLNIPKISYSSIKLIKSPEPFKFNDIIIKGKKMILNLKIKI